MLQKLNERIQGVVAWVVIILIAVTFTLFGIDYYLQSHQDALAEVEVNGQGITKQAFEVNYRRTRQMRDPTLLTAALEAQLKQQVLDDMISHVVNTEAAHSSGFEVNAAQANAAILNIPQFQQDGHFSTNRYQQALNGAMFTPESFQKEVQQGMLLNQQRFVFIGTAFALPSDLDQFVKLYLQTRDYDYLTISSSRFLKQVEVTPQEIAAYYQKHLSEFLSEEKVSIGYLRLSMADIKASIHTSDAQIKRYYEDNQSNYYTPASWQVAHLLFALPKDISTEDDARVKQHATETYQLLLKNPERFAEEVKARSDDKISALKGGVLPWIVAGQTAYDKELVKLTVVGQISPPIKSAHGYELFKLIAYKPAAVKPLDQVKGAIQEQLLVDTAQAKYAEMLEKLSDLSYQTPDSLTPVSEALKLPIQESSSFSRKGGDSELTKTKPVILVAFGRDVMTLGNNSDPIPMGNESVVVIRVNKHWPAAQRTLAEVAPLIKEKLVQTRATDAAMILGKELLHASGPAELNRLVTQNQLKWQSVTAVPRDSDVLHESINETAFRLARIGAEDGRSLDNGDFVLVQLKKINDGKLGALDKEQVASITQQIETNYGMMDYDLYVNDLRNMAQIVKH
ncbi:MAG: SurA N-terminal domain-containing protein [Legionellales bacterium]|nr:SurA N-terminal domain-containing protein [Legionellales bacterium]